MRIYINNKQKMISKLLILIIIFVNYSFAKENYTQFIIKGGGYFNGIYYNSNFTEFKGYPTCCQNYDHAVGMGFGGFFGAEYLINDKFFGFKISTDALISFQSLSANYQIEEKIGNIISGNSSQDGIVENIIEPSINAILIEPGLNIFPFDEIPISFRLGFQLGLPLGMTFIQEENLVSPSWLIFEETNSTKRYHYEGSIPEAAKFYSALSLGVKYTAFAIGNLNFSPIVNFNYGLTNLASGMDWKAMAFQAGVSIDYRIPKQANIPPLDAPRPVYPSPPSGEEFYASLMIYKGSRVLNNNDTLIVPVHENKFINTHIVLPLIYYRINTTQMLFAKGVQLRSEESAQELSFESASFHLNRNPEVSVELYCSYLDTENPDTVKKRISDIKNYLLKSGVDKSRINVKESMKDASKYERVELLEDNCFIRFDFSDNSRILTFNDDTVSKKMVEPVEITIQPEIKTGNLSVESEGILLADGIKISDFKNTSTDINIPENTLDILKSKNMINLNVKLSAKDIFGKEKYLDKKIYLRRELVNESVFKNVISDIDQSNYVQQMVLAYCEFDKADLYAINNNAVELVKSSFKEGKLIEIIPLFDFLGTDEHNNKLAEDRAASAIKLLGLTKDDVQITIPKDYFFSNDHAYGRMMNRAVIVRIKDIK